MFRKPLDPSRREPARRGGPFLGSAQIGDEVAGQPELRVGGDHQPGPAVGRAQVRIFGVLAQGLVEQPDGVFEVEALLALQ
jgi:hypothetical protein